MSTPVVARGLAVGGLEGGYGSSPVLHGVSFHTGPGEIFGVLGKNGGLYPRLGNLPWQLR